MGAEGVPHRVENAPGRVADHRRGGTATVADGDLDAVHADVPRHPHDAAGQRCSVAQGIADKFTQHQAGVTSRGLEYAGGGEFGDQAPTG